MACIYGNNVGIVPLTDAAGITQEFKPGKHYGIDIGWSSKANDPYCAVLAWQDGTVVDCGYGSQVGNFLVVDHDYGSEGHRWTGYIHLKDKPNLRVGDKVYFGKQMGNARRGNTGQSAGVHLHMYLTKIVSKLTKYTWGQMKAVSIDPKPYLYYDKKYNTEYISAAWTKPLPAPQPKVVDPVARNVLKDQLICSVDNLRVRKEPSLKGDKIGHLQKDKYYNYFDAKENDGYTWYKLAEGQWIAKIEEVTILPKETVVEPVERDTEKNQLLCHIDNLRVRTKPSLVGEQIGFLQSNKYYNWYEIVEADHYKWYRIAENQWVAGIDELDILPKVEYYTVVEGDTLQNIAQKRGITLEKLVMLNPQLVKIGEQIRVE